MSLVIYEDVEMEQIRDGDPRLPDINVAIA